ncbi:MAG: hypothetical protein SCABRO_02471 [Candidatus Scalindua brodae]|uniref:ABC-2 type transporter transmembrane domain-containing protein n=1 Tax=Candidatus Scalindua brodae TaxID=237368 RepID=A0A0B0EM73_9BACT|nr:MAG: hypothetical protein SCABRO_02471 [Candidatus Scalindua brodae]
MAVVIPMMLLVLFGYALKLDVENVPMAVWDQSESQISREFVSRFEGSRYFSLHGYVRNYREIERAIDSGDAFVASLSQRTLRVLSSQVAQPRFN